MDLEEAPAELRDGVRDGIRSSIRQDVELRGGRTARLLLAAGVVGVIGAIGVTLPLVGHPFGHHPAWHVVVFSTVSSGLLIVSLAIAFLRVRTPSMPLSQAALVGVLGLGIAGVCGALCPDPHFLNWWSETSLGKPLSEAGGPALSALCFGFLTTVAFGSISALALLRGQGLQPAPVLLPAIFLAVLLTPGVALQTVGTSASVLGGWLVGTFGGAYLGVAGAVRLRAPL